MTLFEFTLSSEIIKNLSYDVVFQMEKYGQDIALRMISGQGRNTEPSKLPLREAGICLSAASACSVQMTLIWFNLSDLIMSIESEESLLTIKLRRKLLIQNIIL